MNLDQTVVWWGVNSSRIINSDTAETVLLGSVCGTEGIHGADFAVTLTLPFFFSFLTFFKR